MNIFNSVKGDDEPPSRWFKVAVFIIIMVFLAFPSIAHKAEEKDNSYDRWDVGTIKMPVILQTVITAEERLPEVEDVKSYGNGTCVPYARSRSGIELYGWAGEFLDKAEGAGYIITEVPMEGAIMVTSESNGHVAVVEEVSKEGVIISEQNYEGLYIVSKRILPFESDLILGYIR